MANKVYTTERAKKTGKANACSGNIFVTVALDHFGPILAENDSERGTGVLVGETWEDRMECRQWGAHLPHVAGISGQSDYGAQSVALSGDMKMMRIMETVIGSGGRDLSGNKRTNKTQSFDLRFEKFNEALQFARCPNSHITHYVYDREYSVMGFTGLKNDGRKPGIQGYKVCRYLFVRCDNDPAPWTSDENGDRPRSLPLPSIDELIKATDITKSKATPSWDCDNSAVSSATK
ncbi:zinc finger, PHD-type, SRA-YDG, Zinc finger, RING/FYVE/PHD-type, PUA-like domain protein [Artemisia annua]|uniref:Zinc finger, PHD-type, SRA-YDG, Zinc finger, RING/FYVE/PHD-type, PUA-like domain protein n=1 Tax=Artemisia annua TaxID=35608 RepID=A0A2U1N9R6_ARTAN|nr:zinc finger, PHD-type, SRA-YDG, Zinc finger, RING/FYVE/PHD-type, PUA-like domain protein [Artemisia annua]